MLSFFYLTSHDYISTPEPRRARIIKIISGMRRRDYVVVEIAPPLPGSLFSRNEAISRIIVGTCDLKKTLQDVTEAPVMVDLLFSADFEDPIDERRIQRIGVGTAHATLEEATKYSALG